MSSHTNHNKVSIPERQQGMNGSVSRRDVPSLNEKVLFLGISYILPNYIITIYKS